MESNGSISNNNVYLRMPDNFTMPTKEAKAVWIYFVLPAPLTFSQGFGIYTYDVDIEDNPSAEETHAFVVTAAHPQIIQNYITTITFGSLDIQGNNGNINGAGWSPTKPNP